MANLLPPQDQKRVRWYFRARFIATGSLIAIVCGCAALLALLPVYAIARGAHATDDPSAVHGGISEEQDREDVARARLLLHELESVTATSSSSLTILAEIFNVRPRGTSITSIFFERGEESAITLAGMSTSRDDIGTYREALLKDARFKNVTVPIGVLAGTAGKTFTMTITGTF